MSSSIDRIDFHSVVEPLHSILKSRIPVRVVNFMGKPLTSCATAGQSGRFDQLLCANELFVLVLQFQTPSACKSLRAIFFS